MKIYLKSALPLKNMLLFVNGYRDLSSFDGSTTNNAEPINSDNTVHQADLFNYWEGIDIKFSRAIGTRNMIYADGHHSVATANHGSVSSFLSAMTASDTKRKYCTDDNQNDNGDCNLLDNDAATDVTYLHTTKNVNGFNIRKQNGAIAGLDLVAKINNGSFEFNKITDTLDIVAHSMCYAYALGMIEKLKLANIKLGCFYILAPENACSGGTDWTAFEEVWQYGSDLGKPNNDPMYLQDGVAPQCECTSLEGANETTNAVTGKKVKTGRVFIPKADSEIKKTKGFVGSHKVTNYGWIFKRTIQQDGYVKKRK